MITVQRCYGGVRYLDGAGPSMMNVARLDSGAVPMIQCMARTGLQVDLAHFAHMETELVRDLERITEEVRDLTGVYCNLDSGDQKAELLFKTLGLKQAHPKMTNSGSRESVEDAVLTAIQHDHPVVPLFLEYAELSKLKGTYVSPMPKLARRTSFGKWRMYPNFKTTRIPSGRIACAEPNLLAMPTRTDRGRDIRKGFITDEGWVYVSCDQAQIEPRVAAHRSKDTNLLRVYENEEDLYSDFATGAFKLQDRRFKDDTGWHYPTVDKDAHRRPSKTCVLAAIYDVTAGGLLEQMPIICGGCNKKATEHTCSKFRPVWTENKCQDLINAFYIRYPGLMQMRKRDHRRAQKYGYLWDDWGRILHTTAVRSVLEWVVSAALREAANFPIQATACGSFKVTMAAVQHDLEQGLLDVVHPLLAIHDELLFECRADLAEELGQLVSSRFESCVRLDAPVKASVAIAESWGRLPK